MKNHPESSRRLDIPSLILLTIILTLLGSRLVMTHWTNNLSSVITVMYIGLIAGLALGYSNFSKVRTFLFSSYYGMFIIIWQIGLTINQNIPWYERLLIINNRIGITVSYLLDKKPVPDNLFFLLLMSLLFWIIGSQAGFALIRSVDPWKIIVPSGIGIVIIHSYDSYISRKVWYLIVFLFFALILVVRLVYLQKREKWRTQKSLVPANLSTLFIRISIVASVILLVGVWTAPVEAKSFQAAVKAWEQIKEPFKQIRNNFENAFASLQSTVGIIPEFYSTNLALGEGTKLTDTQLFTVLTPDTPPPGTRYYWRVRSYDTYEDGQWISSVADSIKIDAVNNTLQFPDEPKRKPYDYSFYFTTVRPIATLFLVPQPLWVSIPAQAEVINNPDETVDILAIKATPNLTAGTSYEVQASLAGATIHALQNAGEEYPTWVLERYLQIPDSTTQRTKDLALQITEGQETSYDKVEAVTNYLRSNVEYSQTVPKIPKNQDLVDWFLFDLEEGFCNYYASAEVIMLRSLGIPARLAVGYAQGEVQGFSKTYLVRQQDAHAWPEVYFPKLGWIEFEPTSSQPFLSRPSGEVRRSIPTPSQNLNIDEKHEPDAEEEKPPVQDNTTGEGYRSPFQAFFRAMLVGGLLLALIIIIILIVRSQKEKIKSIPPLPILIERALIKLGVEPPVFIKNWAFRASLPVISRAYQELNQALTRLGKRPSPNKTPAERAKILGSVIPELNSQAQTLANEYAAATYGKNPPDELSARFASRQIRYLAYRELFRRGFGGNISPSGQENNSD